MTIERKEDIQKLENMTKSPETYIRIEAKRWFQRSYGNTYHSCKVVLVSGIGEKYKREEIGYEPFSYGYESHYLNTAAKILGVSEGSLRRFMMDSRGKVLERVIDVDRKKDL